jgi:zinc transporter ZupT
VSAGAPAESAARSKAPLALVAALPLVLLAALVLLVVRTDIIRPLRGDAPPVEELAIATVRVTADGFELSLVNDGPDPVKIAQVQVDEAYWSFEQQPPGELTHLDRARLIIPYPWVHGETHELRLLTASGITFDHTVEVAVESPRPSARALGLLALVGLYVGVLPVALGLLWHPALRRLGRWGLDFAMALTLGLLVFLLIDTTHEGLEAAGIVASSYQGTVLFVLVAGLAFLGIETFGGWLAKRRTEASAAWVAALLVAVGIGLHNFGEGLAIGAAIALGEAALGALLIVGFTLHNTTEGLAIVAPLAEERAPVGRLATLGLIAGAPTIAGAWIGGFIYSPFWSVVFLAVGAGAIAQVIVQIGRGVAGDRPVGDYLRSGAVVGGLVCGFGLMYATGLLIG